MQPSQQLGFLIHHLAFVLDRQSDQVLQERLGIGFSQFKILMILSHHEGIGQKVIADKLGQTEASISRQIKVLQSRGLIVSNTSLNNRRQKVTMLTNKGLKLIEMAFDILNQYHRPVFDTLSPKQQSALFSMINIMHDKVCSGDKPGRCHQDNKTLEL